MLAELAGDGAALELAIGTGRVALPLVARGVPVSGIDQQVACFANAAAHLEPGGCFVIEVGVPELRRLPPDEDARVFAHAPGYVGYDRYTDLVVQQATSHHFVAEGSGVRESRTPIRYVWPSELDLMARLAGLTLRDRWAGWDRSRRVSWSCDSRDKPHLADELGRGATSAKLGVPGSGERRVARAA